jgi:hypothetical protein
VEYPGTSESKTTRTSKDDAGENKNEMFAADCHRGNVDATWLALPNRKGVAVNIREFLFIYSNDPRLFPLELTMELLCCSGLYVCCSICCAAEAVTADALF